MGGFGSGRPAYKQKAEDCRSLDVNRLHREGCLKPGRVGNWVWSCDGEEVSRIGYRAKEGRLVLSYRVCLYGDEWESIEQSTRLTYTPCNFGNRRPYFICPGVVNGRACGRRVGKLFLGGHYFLCRHCYNVAYSSQSEPRYDRKLRRANKLRMALGGYPGTANCIAPKPKGMWWRTYEQKCREIERCEGQADLMFLNNFRHLLSQDDLDLFFGD